MTARPDPGTRLIFRWRKWDGSPHWEHDCVFLGSDEWGDWFGQQIGWRSHRPGRDFLAEAPNVTLLPPGGEFAMTVNRDHPRGTRIYIDIAWDARWSDEGLPEGIDMDLDVVLAFDGRGLYIDDRDEWEEHRVRYGYPPEIVQRLEAVALDLEQRVARREPPYDDGTADAWLDRLAASA